jgi:hypothetical protein
MMYDDNFQLVTVSLDLMCEEYEISRAFEYYVTVSKSFVQPIIETAAKMLSRKRGPSCCSENEC